MPHMHVDAEIHPRAVKPLLDRCHDARLSRPWRAVEDHDPAELHAALHPFGSHLDHLGATVTANTSWSDMATPLPSTAAMIVGSEQSRPRAKSQSILPKGGGGVPSGRGRRVGAFARLPPRHSEPRPARSAN